MPFYRKNMPNPEYFSLKQRMQLNTYDNSYLEINPTPNLPVGKNAYDCSII